MSVMKPLARLILLLILGCAGAGPDRSLPFDPRPAMGSIREDAAEIARILGSGRSLDAAAPARRLSEIRLGEGQPLPPEFQELEQSFRDAALELARTLDRSELSGRSGVSGRLEHGVRFKHLLERCDACHRRYRPGGISGL